MADGECDQCGFDLTEGEQHAAVECFTNLNSRIEELEDKNRHLEELLEAYRREFGEFKLTCLFEALLDAF